MDYRTLFFDLDDTLYPNTCGLWNAIRERMTDFMRERLNLPVERIPDLRRTYFETYGTTLRGLQVNYHVNTDEYLAYVHDLPLEKYLQPDPELREILLSLSQHKLIFTNADAAHAHRVLSRLGLEGCFDGIIDIHVLDFHCKPDPEAYQSALSFAKLQDAHACVLFDDALRNLIPARAMGFTTVLINSDGTTPPDLLRLTNLHELPARMPELWQRSVVGL
jgi:pyrimidine 5'-nucleotidase